MIDHVADLLGVEPKEVFILASKEMFGKDKQLIRAFDPDAVYNYYLETGYIPFFVVDYCSFVQGENGE